MKTKIFTKIICMILCLSMLLSSVGCNNFEDEDDDYTEEISEYQWENAFELRNVTVTVRTVVDGNDVKETIYVDGGEFYDELWNSASLGAVIPALADKYDEFTFDYDLGEFHCESIDLGGVAFQEITVSFAGTTLSKIELSIAGNTVRYQFTKHGKTHRDVNVDGICDNCGLESGKAPADPGSCSHIDANDDVVCDKCGDNFADGCDLHRDADDNSECDICGAPFTDECESHVDANDDGRCDKTDCNKLFTDGCDVIQCIDTDGDGKCNNIGCERPTTNRPCTHRDADDNGYCDHCGIDFFDECESHRDANDDNVCDSAGCNQFYSDGCDADHRDADDDSKCDIGGEEFFDGCDIHRDADDNGVCDHPDCNKFFDDGCDMHRDADDNGYCDHCGADYSDGPDYNKPANPDDSEDAGEGSDPSTPGGGSDPSCPHRDANDNYQCDYCGEGFVDLCDLHRDRDDDGKCDFCDEHCDDGCDVHRDADDDFRCDICGIHSNDGIDTLDPSEPHAHRDLDDDYVCDFCAEYFDDGHDFCYDHDDDGVCDFIGWDAYWNEIPCGKPCDDGCNNHVDADDNGRCDVPGCRADWYDGCDNMVDKNGDGICENCWGSMPGTKDNPFRLDVIYDIDWNPIGFSTFVESGKKVYFTAYISDVVVTIACPGIVFAVVDSMGNETVIEPIDGVITYEVASGVYLNTVFAITNIGTNDADIFAEISYRKGDSRNPLDLELGEVTAEIPEGVYDYYYAWTVTENGYFTLTFKGDLVNNSEFMCSIYNLSTYVVSFLNGGFYNEEMDLTVFFVYVNAGEKLQIRFENYPDENFAHKAKTVNFTASLEFDVLCSHRDLDDDYVCDFCAEYFDDGHDFCYDYDDDGVCDYVEWDEYWNEMPCGKPCDDGCDNHVDADDDGICDVEWCDEYFDDGCDNMVDMNDDGVCENCGGAMPGTRDNPIYFGFYHDEFGDPAGFIVHVGAGEVVYFEGYVDGKVVTIEGSDFVLIVVDAYGNETAVEPKDGVITYEFSTAGGSGWSVFAIVNYGAYDAEINAKAVYAEGTMNKPADLEFGEIIKVELDEKRDSFFYEWYAIDSGWFTLYFEGDITQNSEFKCYISNLITHEAVKLSDATYNRELDATVLSTYVYAGESLLISLSSVSDEYGFYPVVTINLLAFFEYATCLHRDADDNSRCDYCGMYFDDGVDIGVCPETPDRTNKFDDIGWDETDVIMQLNLNSSGNELEALTKRYMAGESEDYERIDDMVLDRNQSAMTKTGVYVTYTYLEETDKIYWGKYTNEIATDIATFTQGESPDMYCGFAYDLSMSATLGHFKNLYNDGGEKGNFFTFLLDDYRPQYDDEGYLIDFMKSVTPLPETKMYLYASNYTLDAFRAAYVIPVSISLLHQIDVSDLPDGSDADNSGAYEINEFYNMIWNVEWTYDMMATLSAAIYSPTATSTENHFGNTNGFVLDTSMGLPTVGMIYSTDFYWISQNVDEYGNYSYYVPETNTQLEEMAIAYERLFNTNGIFMSSASMENTQVGTSGAGMGIRQRFSEDKILFGNVVIVGQLDYEAYQNMEGGFGIAPIPLYEAYEGAEYKTALHNIARVIGISKPSAYFSECTAFLDYQALNSDDVMKQYFRSLQYDTVGGEEYNIVMLEYIRSDIRSNRDQYLENICNNSAIGIISEYPDLNNCKWAGFFKNANFKASEIRSKYDAAVTVKNQALAMLVEMYEALA